jgi:hypothetical protein
MRHWLETTGMPGQVPRAPRYPLALPLAVRAEAGESWYEGAIENASRTGILFLADVALPAETPVELRFRLDAGKRPGGSPVVCRGVVVRSAPAPAGGRTAIAASISGYRFLGEAEGEAVNP